MTASSKAARIKAIAREKSLEKYGTLITANILIFLIQFVAFSLANLFVSDNIFYLVINQLMMLIINTLLGVLVSGKAYLYLNLIYSQTTSTSDVFFGLKQHPDKAALIQSVFVWTSFVASLPMTVAMYMLRTTKNQQFIGLWVLAALFALAVKLYISITFSQAFFVLHDFPDRSAKEILLTSRRLMYGNRFKLLYIYVSFIPLYLFGVLTFFIPLLWVSVYRYATVAAFYQDLMASNNTK